MICVSPSAEIVATAVVRLASDIHAVFRKSAGTVGVGDLFRTGDARTALAAVEHQDLHQNGRALDRLIDNLVYFKTQAPAF